MKIPPHAHSEGSRIAEAGPPVRMASVPCPTCPLCGSQGTGLYADLEDRLFHVPGRWNFDRCRNSACGIAWLNPMPLESELGKAYAEYYTHADATSGKRLGPGARLLLAPLKAADRLLRRITGLRAARVEIDRMYLGERTPRKLLEIGCGNGDRLARLRQLGWEVSGQEMDPRAADLARRNHGLQIHVGPLAGVFADARFDAAIMNHVIEHVADPAGLLAHVHRLLKPGGVLVVATPNIESRGCADFGPDCRLLEPPRHLHLFTCRALVSLAQRAGFPDPAAWTTSARAVSIATASFSLRRRGCFAMNQAVPAGLLARGLWFQYRAWLSRARHPESGEECVLKAEKQTAASLR